MSGAISSSSIIFRKRKLKITEIQPQQQNPKSKISTFFCIEWPPFKEPFISLLVWWRGFSNEWLWTTMACRHHILRDFLLYVTFCVQCRPEFILWTQGDPYETAAQMFLLGLTHGVVRRLRLGMLRLWRADIWSALDNDCFLYMGTTKIQIWGSHLDFFPKIFFISYNLEGICVLG